MVVRAYWIAKDSHALMRMPVGGGTPEQIYAGDVSALAANDSHLYWVGAAGLSRSPLGGGAPTALLPGPIAALGLVLDAVNVYWVDSDQGTVMKLPLAGGKPTTLAGGQGEAFGIAVDEHHVYWTSQTNGTVMKTPIEGGSPTTLVSGLRDPGPMAVDAFSVYWMEMGSGPADGTVKKAPIGGGAVTTLAAQQPRLVGALAVDASHVYWTNLGDGALHRVGLCGELPVTLHAQGGGEGILGLALDDDNVYWTNYDTNACLEAREVSLRAAARPQWPPHRLPTRNLVTGADGPVGALQGRLHMGRGRPISASRLSADGYSCGMNRGISRRENGSGCSVKVAHSTEGRRCARGRGEGRPRANTCPGPDKEIDPWTVGRGSPPAAYMSTRVNLGGRKRAVSELIAGERSS